jgi:uncharacterized OB-fold protein
MTVHPIQPGTHGHVVSYTIIRVPPASFAAEAPYALAIIELDGGQRLLGRVLNWEHGELAIGATVELQDWDPTRGPLFRLVHP